MKNFLRRNTVMTENEKITKKFVLQELEILLRDEFVCGLENDGEKIYMTLNNGQKFAISVSECE